MKKMYTTPVVEINETMASQMMALSIQTGAADDSDVLVKGEQNDVTWDLEW